MPALDILSRSDVTRTICTERETVNQTADFYFDETGCHERPHSQRDGASRAALTLILAPAVPSAFFRDRQGVVAEPMASDLRT